MTGRGVTHTGFSRTNNVKQIRPVDGVDATYIDLVKLLTLM